jgi:hypothetical protein
MGLRSELGQRGKLGRRRERVGLAKKRKGRPVWLLGWLCRPSRGLVPCAEGSWAKGAGTWRPGELVKTRVELGVCVRV